MTTSLYKKGIVLGIIVLFIGTGVPPNLFSEIAKADDPVTITLENWDSYSQEQTSGSNSYITWNRENGDDFRIQDSYVTSSPYSLYIDTVDNTADDGWIILNQDYDYISSHRIYLKEWNNRGNSLGFINFEYYKDNHLVTAWSLRQDPTNDYDCYVRDGNGNWLILDPGLDDFWSDYHMEITHVSGKTIRFNWYTGLGEFINSRDVDIGYYDTWTSFDSIYINSDTGGDNSLGGRIYIDDIQITSGGNQPPSESLIAYWNFNEGAETTVLDSAGDNDGTIYGASYTSNNGGCSGEDGDYALEFVQSEHDYVLTPLNQLGEQTISLWFKIDTIQEGKGIAISTHAKDDNTGNLAVGIAIFSGVAVVCIDHASSSSWWDPPMLSTGPGTNYDYNDDTWHHMALTHDGSGNYELFVDGIPKDTYSGSVLSDVRPYMFGRLQQGTQGEGYWFDGLLDEVRIYNCVLSNLQIQTLVDNPGGGGDNQPPYVPNDPKPCDHGQDVFIYTDLKWSGGDPDSGDSVVYDLYLDINDPTPDTLISEGQSSVIYDPGILNPNSHYYWKVIAKDNHGESSIGPIWEFQTSDITIPKGKILVYVTEDGTGDKYDKDYFDDDLPEILENYAYQVTVTDRETIPELTPSILDDFDQLWIFSTNEYSTGCFSQTEIDLILSFHNEGNGLLIAADHRTYGDLSFQRDANQISIPFGVEFISDVYQAEPSNLVSPSHPTHPIFNGVDSIVASDSEADMRLFNTDAEVLAQHNDYDMVSILDVHGRVVFDSSFTRYYDAISGGNQWILMGDTSQYIRNIADWLIGSDIDQGLVGEWMLNEGQGPIILDTSENQNNGYINGATYVDYCTGYSLAFDGVDDIILIPDDVAFDFASTNELTIQLCIKWNGNTYPGVEKTIISDMYGVEGFSLSLTDSGKLSFTIGTGSFSNIKSNSALQIDYWHYVSAVWDGSTLSIYIDGLLDSSKNIGPVTIQNSDKPIKIGHSYTLGSDDRFAFGGELDDIRFFNSVLNPLLIQNIQPLVFISTPSEPTRISDDYTFSGFSFDANGDVTVKEVNFNIFSENIINRIATGTTCWSYRWDTTELDDGEYTVSVLCEDKYVSSHQENILVLVDNEENSQPEADIGGPYDGFVDIPIVFDLSDCYDEKGDIEWYRIDFNDDGIWDTDWEAYHYNHPFHEYVYDEQYEGYVNLEIKDAEWLYDTDQSFVRIMNYDIETGLQAYWSFNYCNAKDQGPKNYDGTIHGSPSCQPGIYYNSMAFDGKHDYITVDSHVIDDGPFTICAWVKPNSIVNEESKFIITNELFTLKLVPKSGNNNDFYNDWCFRVKNDAYDAPAVQKAESIDWTFVCGTWDGTDNDGSIILYIDGVIQNAGNPGNSGSVDDIKIGGSHGLWTSYIFNGLIDEIRIYNRVLSDNDIRFLAGFPDGKPFSKAKILNIDPLCQTIGNEIHFAGTGLTSDGGYSKSKILDYSWEIIDGPLAGTTLSNEAEFTTSSLSVGLHKLSFRVRDYNFKYSAPEIRYVQVVEGYAFNPTNQYFPGDTIISPIGLGDTVEVNKYTGYVGTETSTISVGFPNGNGAHALICTKPFPIGEEIRVNPYALMYSYGGKNVFSPMGIGSAEAKWKFNIFKKYYIGNEGIYLPIFSKEGVIDPMFDNDFAFNLIQYGANVLLSIFPETVFFELIKQSTSWSSFMINAASTNNYLQLQNVMEILNPECIFIDGTEYGSILLSPGDYKMNFGIDVFAWTYGVSTAEIVRSGQIQYMALDKTDEISNDLMVTSFCPLDIEVIDSNGNIVNKSVNEIPDSAYIESDFNFDGENDDQIFIPNAIDGDYLIKVIPEPDADLNDTYTLLLNDEGGHHFLAINESISDIPEQGFTLNIGPPTTEKIIGFPKSGENDTWVSESTEFNLSAYDYGSGINKTFYRIWYNDFWSPLPGTNSGIDNNFTEYTGNFTLSGEGKHYIEYYSVDKVGNIENVHNQTHYVDDSTPEITTLDDPFELWSPNHKYHTIELSDFIIDVFDEYDDSIDIDDVIITNVSSDEPENMPYDTDGNTIDDIIIVDLQAVRLRAERNESGNGRVYTINFEVEDWLGNTATDSFKIMVPVDYDTPAVDDGPENGYTVYYP